MPFLKYALMVPAMLVLTAVTFPLAFVLPVFARFTVGYQDNATRCDTGYYLPTWLSWFQTPDNSIDGDQGWREEHWQWRFKLPAPIATYVGRIGWLWRNPAYGFGIEIIEAPATGHSSGDQAVNDSPLVEGSFYVQIGSLWQFVMVKRFGSGRAIYLNLGWNIKGALSCSPRRHIATFAFSPRIVSVASKNAS